MSERCDCHTCVATRQAVTSALQDVVDRLEHRASSAHRGMYRRDEAAIYLGIGRTKLDELARAGELVPVHLGDRLRLYAKADLDSWIDRQRARQAGLRAVR